jgi:hypothetical protein
VSHLKERKEPVCLNCQTNPLYGRFCHICGQENLEPKETVWHLVQHFFNDITHFDGKFFNTVKYLLRRPGFLSAEYTKGRRAAYLNPIRMYVFTSAIFFIILFSLPSAQKVIQINQTPEKAVFKGLPELRTDQSGLDRRLLHADEEEKENIQEKLVELRLTMSSIRKEYGDTTTRKFSKKELDAMLLRGYGDSLQVAGMPPETRERIRTIIKAANDTSRHFNFLGWDQSRYKGVAEYDSIQTATPDSLKDDWFKHMMIRKLVHADEVYNHDPKEYQQHLVENFLHSFPKIMFFSLPFFALILRLLYVRRKKFLYVEHGIFTIHVYCATFMATLALILLNELTNFVHWGWLKTLCNFLIFFLVLYIFIYLYKAMRKFYQQRRAKTIFKYFILLLMAWIVNLVLLVLFFAFSFISV